MKGYKAFDKDLQCRGFQYETGKEYVMDEEPIICQRGFHFCLTLKECYLYYDATEKTRICEIEAFGEIVTNDNIKFATNKIRIGAEVPNPQQQSNRGASNSGFCNVGKLNSGSWNNGYANAGCYNKGNQNAGDINFGNRNTGFGNVGNNNTGSDNQGTGNTGWNNRGDFNTGDFNIGHKNAGYANFGIENSGHFNIGNCNVGDFNIGNFNSGVFGTEKASERTITFFDSPSDWTFEQWRSSRAYTIMRSCPWMTVRNVKEQDMTEAEKKAHPESAFQSGYRRIELNVRGRQDWWDSLSKNEQKEVLSLPNFDATKFFVCTGIDVRKTDE